MDHTRRQAAAHLHTACIGYIMKYMMQWASFLFIVARSTIWNSWSYSQVSSPLTRHWTIFGFGRHWICPMNAIFPFQDPGQLYFTHLFNPIPHHLKRRHRAIAVVHWWVLMHFEERQHTLTKSPSRSPYQNSGSLSLSCQGRPPLTQ